MVTLSKLHTNNGLIKYNIFIIFSLFCFFYYPPSSSGTMIHFIGIISIIYVLLTKQSRINSTEIKYISFYIFLFAYLIFCVSGINGFNYRSCTTPLIFIVDFIPFCIFLSDYYKKHSLSFDDLIAVMLFVALLQSVTAIASFLSPEIHTYFIDRIVQNGGDEVYYSLSAYRMYGYSMGLNFITPCLQGLFSITSLLYSLNHSKLYIVAAIIMLFSAIINARTALMVMAVGFILMTAGSSLGRRRKIWILISSLFVIFIAVFVVVPYINKNANHTFLFIQAGFNQLLNFFISGKRDVGYFAYITNLGNYKLPERLLNTLVGKGSFVMASNNFGYQTDVGYINDIWFGGVIYLVLYYGVIIARLIRLRKSNEKLLSFLALYLLICFLMLNFKGMVFSLNGIMSLTLILYLFSFRMGYLSQERDLIISKMDKG